MSVHRIPSETDPYFPWSREDASLPADYAPSHIMDAADRARMVAECKRLEAVAV